MEPDLSTITKEQVAVEVTPDFKHAFDVLEHSKDNLFITGKAGTGKSTFLDYFTSNTEKNVAVVAPTGVAALNVKGQTIHSFFRFKPGFMDLSTIKRKRQREIYEALDILILDEISMVRADIFAAIETFLRFNGPRKGEPFGGIQICALGDMFQLPPIITRQEEDIYYQFYGSPYFFSTDAFEKAEFQTIEFRTIFRHSEEQFIEHLNKIRTGDSSPETMDFINQCTEHEHVLEEGRMVVLSTTNAVAERINHQKLQQLAGEEEVYEGKVEGKFILNKEKLPAPERLALKPGAQVMFTKNDAKKRWVNGTIGVVTSLSKREIGVSIEDEDGFSDVRVKKENWESIKYDVNTEDGKITESVTGSYKQFPLTPAWAITIHKSQGKTLDRVAIDLGHGTFAPGQLYVALSRCRHFNHILLKRPVTPRDIMLDEQIVAFMDSVL